MSVPMEASDLVDSNMDTSEETNLNCKNNKETDPELSNLQKVDVFVKQLPYFSKIKANAFKTFEELKKNLSECLILNELRPGFTHWSNRLIIFIHEYGLFFTKEDHLKLIKLYLEVLLTPNIDLPVADICLQVLTDLLKKFDKITREDLVIEWRPIYEFYLRLHKINDYSPVLAPENIESSSFAGFIPFARIYFDASATKEMLNEWRPLMCPFDVSMSRAFEQCRLFLPTLLYEHEMEHGYKLWITDFLELWTTFSMRHFWESHMINLFNRVAIDSIGCFDWNPYIPFIFSNIQRGFGLPFGGKDSVTLGIASATTSASMNNNLSQVFTYSSEEMPTLAGWIVAMIGCGGKDSPLRHVCMEHIKRLFQALRSFYYPSNTGSWSANLFAFLQHLPDKLIKRIKKERKDKEKWFDRPTKDYYITDEQILEFVNALKEVSFTAIFSKSNTTQAKKAFQYLTFLRGDIMLPPLIQKIYDSFQSLTEPHRYTSMLGCLVKVSRELVTFNPNHEAQTQLHLLPLLNAVLPGLDPNDSNKTVLTLQFLSHVINCITICDCSPALSIRTDLTDHERDLIFETSKFEDFIHEFFNKLFSYIDNLTSDLQNEISSASANSHNQFYSTSRNKDQEDITQVYMIQTIKILVKQSSKQILKIILNKVKVYISGNTFNIRAGRIVSAICAWLSLSGIDNSAFGTFIDYVHDNLSEIRHSKNYESMLENERGDIEVSWNLQLLSELTKAPGPVIAQHIGRLTELLSWFRNTVHKESINYIGFCYRNILISLVNINPTEMCSVNYSILFDDEKEFFSKHLPTRDWARTGDIHKLNITYYIPSVAELTTAIDFIDSELNKSMKFLSDSINSGKQLTNSTKEERNRELTYINFLLYGGSRLLLRATTQGAITEHIDTGVMIGVTDDLDKGLGFEKSNLDDPDHEYSKLGENYKKILLNKRQLVTEFIIDIAEKLVEQQCTETTLFIHVSRILLVASITYGLFVNDFEKMWKSHSHNKSSMQNKLLGKKSCLRDELITRVALQYKFRTFHIHTILNELDLKVLQVLFKLSTHSIYAVVRRDAQTQLFSVLAHFPYSTLKIVPMLVELLQKSDQALPEESRLTHDQLKGCLYLLRGNSIQDSFMIRQDWHTISSLWPVLFKCQHFEKPSIQELLDKIFVKTNKDFDSFENRIRLGDQVVKLAYEIGQGLGAETRQPNEATRLERFNRRFASETKLIAGLMTELINIAKEPQLLWKNQATSFGSVLFLLNSCGVDKGLLSEECIQLYVDSLIHENINIRKISIDALCIILKMVKHKKEIRRVNTNELVKSGLITVDQAIPGYRPDNSWHSYDPSFLKDCLETNEEDVHKWEQANFLDKSYWGYYCWPNQINVNCSSRKNFGAQDQNEFSAAVKPVEKRFRMDADFVKSFIKYSTIEESKGNEKFDAKKFHLFKALFRNFGSVDIINGLFGHLKRLVSDRDAETHECNHKLASELVAGLIRGSKYWPINELKKMWSELKAILDLVMENITTENIKLWASCFSTSFEDQDPRRMTFYLKYFTDLTTKVFGPAGVKQDSSITSFQQTSYLQLISALNQFEWRIPTFWSNLFDMFLNNMSHPYKAIREKNSLCISLCLISHIDYSKLKNGLVEEQINLRKFVDFVQDKLTKAIELFDVVNEETIDGNVQDKTTYNSEEHLSAINFLQSLFTWIGYYVMKSYQPINKELIRLIPQLCNIDKIAAQDVTLKNQVPIIRMFMSVWILDKELSGLLIDQIEKVAKFQSWHSRMAAIQMCQNFGIFNLFQVDEEIKNRIKKIIIDSLCDEQLEVRVSSCITLTGFIHSNFISADSQLLDDLKALSKIKARTKEKSTGKITVNMAKLIQRHGGILGLCAVVSSCPYDVPQYLPDAVTYLCQFINDPVPIQGSVRKCLSEFRRTHQDNWQEHSLKFDSNQLSVLSDILISPNYYA